jgi:site-specific recombinase XerD
LAQNESGKLKKMTDTFAISLPPSELSPALMNAVMLWADSTTDPSSRRRADLLRDKRNALVGDDTKGAAGFFLYIGKPLETINAADIKRWQAYLEERGLSVSSVYARVSRVSSFYDWLIGEPAFAERIPSNPVKLARPNAPKAYQSERSWALSDEEAKALLQVVRGDARKGSLNAKRDYALLRFFFATGKRRSEVIDLCWGDLRVTDDAIIVRSREKGGLYRATEIRDPGVRAALFDYLDASKRWDFLNEVPMLQPDDPLWLRHDRGAKGQQAVTSHGFVRAFKRYAKRAGLGDVHLHQTRHTVARMVGEQSGDLAEVQTVLGHQNLTTTRVYVDRVAVKRDKHSRAIAGRLGLDEEET